MRLIVTVVLLAAAAAIAAPITRSGRQLNDNILSLGKIKQIGVVVDPLPRMLGEAGVSIAEIRDDWTRQLKAAGFEVAEGESIPQLRVHFQAGGDPHFPNGVIFGVTVVLEQMVRVERIDRTLRVPTWNTNAIGVELREAVKKAVTENLELQFKQFLADCHAADRP